MGYKAKVNFPMRGNLGRIRLPDDNWLSNTYSLSTAAQSRHGSLLKVREHLVLSLGTALQLHQCSGKLDRIGQYVMRRNRIQNHVLDTSISISKASHHHIRTS